MRSVFVVQIKNRHNVFAPREVSFGQEYDNEHSGPSYEHVELHNATFYTDQMIATKNMQQRTKGWQGFSIRLIEFKETK